MYPLRFAANHLEVEVLKKGADLSSFDCSDNDRRHVNDFFHNEALMYQNENMGVTYIFYFNSNIVGFVTISMTNIDGKETPDNSSLEFFGLKKPPAMLIGQLGVHNKVRFRGLGSLLCDWCEGKAIALSDQIGCRYLVLHTEQELIPFYEKNGFETKKPNKKSPVMVKKIPNKQLME